MRRVLLTFILQLAGTFLLAQSMQPIFFHGQPQMEDGLAIGPHARFYQSRSNDTTENVFLIARKTFKPQSEINETKFSNNRQLENTSQVIWLQFKIANTHPTDTVRLWYDGGVHAVVSMFMKVGSEFRFLERSGMCVPVSENHAMGPFALPLTILPGDVNHYYARVDDYLLLFDDVPGTIQTAESYQSKLIKESNETRALFFAMVAMIGCLGLMTLYAFFQFLLNRERAVIYYAFYAALSFLWIVKFTSTRFNLGLTPDAIPWLAHPWSLSFSHILSFTYALFLITLLSVPQQQPRLWKVIRALMIVVVVLQIAAVIQLFTGIPFVSAKVFFLVDGLPSLIIGILLVAATIRSQTRLKFYLIGGQFALYAISLSPFHGLLLPEKTDSVLHSFASYPPFFMALGLVIELFCFLLALAYRYRLLAEEKNGLQQRYMEDLKSELLKKTIEIKQKSQLLEDQYRSEIQQRFEHRLAEMKITALRAQMNPHFIFNCLNSIKLYTTDNDSAHASLYLSKFSRLIRSVLENSGRDMVTLKEELEALQLYLEMESMRFKDKLKFSIEVLPELEPGLIEIPPMLVQPYVENAIWHGLMHKTEGGSVHVFVRQSDADHLLVSIKDDGIGRSQSAAIKSKRVMEKKSFGMNLTMERIALINQTTSAKTRVVVNDLFNAEGLPLGTEVLLHISI